MQLKEARKALQEGKGNLRCAEVTAILETLGFEVRDGKRGGHKLFFHHGLPEFYSGSFNCGHGKNPEIKPGYISKILRTLEIHETALSAFLGEDETHD